MRGTKPHIDQFYIQVNGEHLPISVMNQLDDALIEDDLAQPATFALRFNDPQLSLLDGNLFQLGTEVRLAASDIHGKSKLIMVGEITSLEPLLEQHNMGLVVRGYDRAHRLQRGSHTRTFLNQSDEEIVGQIAREAGLKTDIEPIGDQHPYVIQHGQTDLEFLRERAARIGYRVVVDDATLRFRHAPHDPPEASAQDWGTTLLSFRARLTPVAQPNEVHVRGWDAHAKRAVLGRATRPSRPPHVTGGQSPGQTAAQAFGKDATVVVSDRPVHTQGEADRMAQGALDQISGNYLAAEGVCRGEPTIRAGAIVPLTSIGSRLSGKYMVTASRHEYAARTGYTTTFYITGHRPNSLFGALAPARRHGVGGVAIGVVTNVDDPARLGRVKVSFPWLDEQHESDWARLALPWAGAQRGLFATVAVDDEVLVAFEQGDINSPFVVGCLWNGKDRPPQQAVRGARQLVLLATPHGHTILLDDAEQRLAISSKQHSVVLDDAAGSISMTAGGQEVKLDKQGRTVRIASDNAVEISGPGGDLRIGPQGIELVSKAKLDVRASAILNIRGSLVNINS